MKGFKTKTILLAAAVCFFLLVPQFALAQNEAKAWYFGHKAGLDFNSGTPVAVTNGQMDTDEGCSSIADSLGNILFYTDGKFIYNRNHSRMPASATGLQGSITSTQSALIIPKPGSKTIYYIFCSGENGITWPNRITYSELDMTLDGGLGDIVPGKQNILLNLMSCEKLCGVRHCDHESAWVVTHDYGSDVFRTYLVTSAGVDTVPVISHAGQPVNGFGGEIGYLKASPDGRKLASARTMTPHFVELLDFDIATGMASGGLTLHPFQVTEGPYGVEFSPDGTKLYCSICQPGRLVQYDIGLSSDSAIVNSGDTLYASGFVSALQLATDKKIYASYYNGPWLGVINNPDSAGAACNFVQQGVSLAGQGCSFGLPNFISSYFYSSKDPLPFQATVNCLDATFTIPAENLRNYTSVNWDFGDTISHSNNSSASINPVHSYMAEGHYAVRLILFYPCRSDTIEQVITINKLPSAEVTLIRQEDISGQLHAAGGKKYDWFPKEGLSCYDCDSPEFSQTETTGYCAIVTDSNGCSDTACTTVLISSVFIPNAFTPNENDLNEVFKPELREVTDFSFVIYDRWGKKVFESGNCNEGWNGYEHGKPCEEGIYIYKLVFIDKENNVQRKFVGKLALLR